MTKPLDPEMKSLRAIARALRTLDRATADRVLRWARQRFVEDVRTPDAAAEGEGGV